MNELLYLDAIAFSEGFVQFLYYEYGVIASIVYPGNCQFVTTTQDICTRCHWTANFREQNSLFWCTNPNVQPQHAMFCYEDECEYP